MDVEQWLPLHNAELGRHARYRPDMEFTALLPGLSGEGFRPGSLPSVVFATRDAEPSEADLEVMNEVTQAIGLAYRVRGAGEVSEDDEAEPDSEGDRVLDVDGETVVFRVHPPGPEIISVPHDYHGPHPADGPWLLSGRGRDRSACLESPPSRANVDDCPEDELRDLWRREGRKAAGE